MIPILFPKDATTFDGLGTARLPDTISCLVTEERNGAFELEMVYPVSGHHFADIAEDMILVAVAHDGGTKQAFRIYRITTPINGEVTINARHISYQLGFIPIPPVNGTATAQAMMRALKTAAQETCPFNFYSDITGSLAYSISTPVSLRNALGGVRGSVLDVHGGEYEWDNWDVHLWKSRGADNGVRILYGKNITNLERSVDIGETITGVAAYYQGQNDAGQNVTVYSNPRVISNDNVANYAHPRTIVLDVSGEFETVPTAAQVTAYARSYLAATTLAQVSEAVTVDFVPLWQTPEYKAVAPLERVSLCDTVYVGYRQLGITVKKKVTKTVYDVLLDRYQSIELGGEANVADTIAQMATEDSGLAKDLARLSSSIVSLGSSTVAKAGDTMTGRLNIYGATDSDSVIGFRVGSRTGIPFIKTFGQGDSNNSLAISGSQNLFLGSGESVNNAWTADLNSMKTTNKEDLYLLADNKIYVYAGCNTIANAVKAIEIDTDGSLIIPSQEISPTIPSSPSGITSVTFNGVRKCGPVVTMSFVVGRDTTSLSSYATIATGLPVPAYVVQQNGNMPSNYIDRLSDRPLYCRITTAGALQVAWGTPSTGSLSYTISLTYMTA